MSRTTEEASNKIIYVNSTDSNKNSAWHSRAIDPLAALNALSELRETRPSATLSKRAVTGPFDRRLSSTRCISITNLVPEGVELLTMRESLSGLILSTEITHGILVPVQTSRNRREVWLRGNTIRPLVNKKFGKRGSGSQRKSILLEVYKRQLPRHGFELELVRRGSRRSPW